MQPLVVNLSRISDGLRTYEEHQRQVPKLVPYQFSLLKLDLISCHINYNKALCDTWHLQVKKVIII